MVTVQGANPSTLAADGCLYSASVVPRGGGAPVAEVDYEHISFGRKVDETTAATVGVAADCVVDLADVENLVHELAVYRNGNLVWTGPIIGIKDGDDGLATINARDLTWWFERRVLPYDRTFVQVDLATIFATLASDAMANDPSPNLSISTTLTGILGTRTIFGPPVEAKRAADLLRELARSGVDFVALGRTLRVGGEEIPADPIAGFTDDHFASYDIDRSGLSVATRVLVTGKGAAFGDSGIASDTRGLVEQIAQENTIEDDISATAAAVSRRQMLSADDPAYVTGSLNGTAPVRFDDLIPGVRVGLSLQNTRRPVLGQYRLGDLTVNIDNRSNETIATSFIPLGTVQ